MATLIVTDWLCYWLLGWMLCAALWWGMFGGNE